MKEYKTITELDKLYNCKDYTIKVKLNSNGLSSIYDTPISPNMNDMLTVLHNIDANMYGAIIVSDGEHEHKEPFSMSIYRFRTLNQAINNILNDSDWKRKLNAFISTKLEPLNCNKNATKQAFDMPIEEFLLDMDIESLYLESDIRDYYALGVELVDTHEIDIPMDLQEYIDYDAYAHDWNNSDLSEPVGIMTHWGYLYYSEYGSKF